jgi:ADP-L-glycero-D-manno-heptose 6-epimerase
MIIVTGGAGFIGSVLVWKLNSLGIKDILLVDYQAEGDPKWKNLESLQYSDYLESDIFLEKVRADAIREDVEAVFHMGACSDTTEADENYLNENNVEYSKTLCEWSLKKNASFLYASSAATYGAGELGYSDKDELTSHLKPLNLYGESKRLFDLWVLDNNLQTRVAGFKFFNVFGPNEYHKGHMRSLVHKGYEQIKRDGKIRLFKSYRPEYKDGEQVRDFVYVKDVVETLVWFWKHPECNGIYNLGSGIIHSWNDLANAIFAALGLPSNIEYIEMPEKLKNQYQYHTLADLTKLKNAGYSASPAPFEESVEDYIINYLEKESPHI